MGLNLKRHMRQTAVINLSAEEINNYMEYFRKIDLERKGFITLNDLRRYLQVKVIEFLQTKREFLFQMTKKEISEEEFRILINEIDQNQNGIIETEEFLQVEIELNPNSSLLSLFS